MTLRWIIAAEHNYDPATEAALTAIYGPSGSGPDPAADLCDQIYLGSTYDRVRRAMLYEMGFALTTPATNSSGFTLWTGNSAITNSSTYDATRYGGHFLMAKGADAPFTVTANPCNNSSLTIPSGLGRYQNIATGTITGGTGYVTGTYDFVAMTGGSGLYAFANITVNGSGVVSAVAFVWAYKYAVSDVLTTSNANLGSTGSGFYYTVNTVKSESDGTWRRITQILNTPVANFPRLVNPGTGDFWTHALSDDTDGFGCCLYLFRRSDTFAQAISPLFPAEGGNWNSHMQPQSITANWFYYIEFTNSSGTFFVGAPAGINAAETAVDFLLPYFWFSTPEDFSSWAFNSATATSGISYFFMVDPAASPRQYELHRFNEPSAASPYNTATTGGGFTNITPWDSTHGPNTNAAAYTAADYLGWTYTAEGVIPLYLPATNQLALISKYFPADKPASPTQTDLFFDCTYVGAPDGGSPTFDYHHAFVTGFMDVNFAPLASTGNTIPAGAVWAVIDCQEIDSYINQSSYEYTDTQMSYVKRAFLFTVQGVTSGTFSADSTQYQVLHVWFTFVSGSAPTVANPATDIITEAGWDAQLVLNPDYPGRAVISATHKTAQLTAATFATDDTVYSNGVSDTYTSAFWWSGNTMTMWDVSNPLWENLGNVHNLSLPTPPILRLAFQIIGPAAPGTGGKVYMRRSKTRPPVSPPPPSPPPPPPPPSYPDGFSGAPNASPSYTGLRASVSYSPPWHIADVDPNYGLGPATGAVTKTAGVDAFPAGTTTNAPAKQVTITGSNVVFSGWNMLGWQIICSATCVSPTFEDCEWTLQSGSANSAIVTLTGASGTAVVARCRVNGNNINHDTEQNADFVPGASLSWTMTYSQFANAYCDAIDILTALGSNVSFQFCSIANNGQAINTGGHPNQVFAFGSATGITFSYCTFVLDTAVGSPATRGLSFGDNFFVPNIVAVSVENCTFFYNIASQVSYLLSVDTSQVQSTTFSNNYINPTGLAYGTYDITDSGSGPYAGGVIRAGNINMLTGAPINS